jgi:hypothetical protein
MPIPDAVTRVAEIQTLAQQAIPPTALADAGAFSSALSAASLPTAYPTALAAPLSPLAALAQQSYAAQPYALNVLGSTYAAQAYAPTAVGTGGTNGANALAAAQSQVGASEQPPGSNDGPQLAVYRTAVAGSAAGQPWCATFVSWAAAQAGAPIGDNGSGSASVAAIADWASRTGRFMPASSTPSPGDLIVFGDRHIGMVESVNADGSLTTVEGNHASAVSRVQRSPSEATGYVRL